MRQNWTTPWPPGHNAAAAVAVANLENVVDLMDEFGPVGIGWKRAEQEEEEKEVALESGRKFSINLKSWIFEIKWHHFPY
jgi:hypothetical protein